MKKKIISVIVLIMMLLVTFLPATTVVFFLPSQYTQTFYGEFNPMLDKLKRTEGKKIVIIGNSAVPFGVDSALLEQEIRKVGMDYSVCNFGLYGALGTKFMMDAALPHIHEGDLVLLMPEPTAQCMSLYFSGKEIWRAIDGAQETLLSLKPQNINDMAGSFYPFAAEKARYFLDMPPTGSGVYSQSSFDENCDLKNAVRNYNIMDGQFDENNLDLCDTSFVDDEFIHYVNSFAHKVRATHARVLFGFCPINQLAVEEIGIDRFNNYFTFLQEKLHVRMLGDPDDFIYPAGWFYDSNVHLNSSGMTVNTVQLIDALKLRYGKTESTKVDMPPMPEPLPDDKPFFGDDSHSDMFLYEEKEDGYIICGLSEKGKHMKELIVPSTYQGKPIKYFAANTFTDNTTIEKITLQKNIVKIMNRSFKGCTALAELHLKHATPSQISVGMALTDGVPGLKIFVPKDGLASYINNYFWSKYADKIEGERYA